MNGNVAVGLGNDDEDDAPGRIDVIGSTLKRSRTIFRKSCVFVKSVQWSYDCKFLVSFCEGEGPEIPGGILVADFGGPEDNSFRGASVATFNAFDQIERFLDENGVRLVESRKPSLDLDPEYDPIDGHHAFVTLQENNAIAVVDLQKAVVTELKPIGFIKRNRDGFGLDASDKDR